jgi:hypothetical protein
MEETFAVIVGTPIMLSKASAVALAGSIFVPVAKSTSFTTLQAVASPGAKIALFLKTNFGAEPLSIV